jgi:uncharacterized membrane protein
MNIAYLITSLICFTIVVIFYRYNKTWIRYKKYTGELTEYEFTLGVVARNRGMMFLMGAIGLVSLLMGIFNL